MTRFMWNGVIILLSGLVICVIFNSIHRINIINRSKAINIGMCSADVRKIMGNPDSISSNGILSFLSNGRSYVYLPWCDVYIKLSPPYINYWNLRMFGYSGMDVVVHFGANDLVTGVNIPLK